MFENFRSHAGPNISHVVFKEIHQMVDVVLDDWHAQFLFPGSVDSMLNYGINFFRLDTSVCGVRLPEDGALEHFFFVEVCIGLLYEGEVVWVIQTRKKRK